MNSRRTSGIPLQDRGNRLLAAVGSGQEARTATPNTRHCWVQHPTLGRCPGLVLRWLHEHAQWQALVVFVDDRGAAITTWVPAEALTPAG